MSRDRRWRAQIQVSGRLHHLGYFDNVIDAVLAYDRAARSRFGEYARTNYPPFAAGENAQMIQMTEAELEERLEAARFAARHQALAEVLPLTDHDGTFEAVGPALAEVACIEAERERGQWVEVKRIEVPKGTRFSFVDPHSLVSLRWAFYRRCAPPVTAPASAEEVRCDHCGKPCSGPPKQSHDGTELAWCSPECREAYFAAPTWVRFKWPVTRRG